MRPTVIFYRGAFFICVYISVLKYRVGFKRKKLCFETYFI